MLKIVVMKKQNEYINVKKEEGKPKGSERRKNVIAEISLLITAIGVFFSIVFYLLDRGKVVKSEVKILDTISVSVASLPEQPRETIVIRDKFHFIVPRQEKTQFQGVQEIPAQQSKQCKYYVFGEYSIKESYYERKGETYEQAKETARRKLMRQIIEEAYIAAEDTGQIKRQIANRIVSHPIVYERGADTLGREYIAPYVVARIKLNDTIYVD